jgi:5-methylcytosine-specific restriction enzyme B
MAGEGAAVRDGPEQVYELADEIRDRCLRRLDSLLMPGASAWTESAAAELIDRFVNAPDVGSGTFLEKLRTQLAGADSASVLLMADLAVIYEVVPVNVGVAAKRRVVEGILKLAGDKSPLPAKILDAFTGGIANPGMWYLARPDVQFSFLVRFAAAFTALSEEERTAAATDPWQLRQVAGSVPVASGYGQRAALLHLMFPDTFESIIASQDKRRILDFYAERLGERTRDEDKDMLALRRAFATDTPEPIFFYRPPWDGWRTTKATTPGWLVRDISDGDNDPTHQWLADGYCALAAPGLPQLPTGTAAARIGEAVREASPDLGVQERRSRTAALDRFLNRMKDGHLVVTTRGRDVFVGRASAAATWHHPGGPAAQVRRSVQWLNLDQPVQRGDLSAGAVGKLTGQAAVSELGPYSDEILARAEADSADTTTTPASAEVGLDAFELPNPTQALADKLFVPLAWLREVIDLLRERGQIVFYGPPGTGKTYLAQHLAEFLTETGGEHRLVQFHPSYAYEDFFEGFRPRPGETPGSIVFDLVPGPLRRIAKLADADPYRPYVLIIDELNRANLAKVFGELYFLLEYRTRTVSLQYSSDEDFTLPRNLLVIGTMNTADRSIALVDQAMRRRFDFVPLFPGREPLVGMLRRWLADNAISRIPADLLDALNGMLGDPDTAIGPSYFMTDRARTEAGLRRIWQTAILPLLEERFAGGEVDVHSVYSLDNLLTKVTASTTGTTSLTADSEPGTQAVFDDRTDTVEDQP